MSKGLIREILCKVGIHNYKHHRKERFYPHKIWDIKGFPYRIGTKSITHFDKCCCCGKIKNKEHIKLSGCSMYVLKFPKLIKVQEPIFTETFAGCKLKVEVLNESKIKEAQHARKLL